MRGRSSPTKTNLRTSDHETRIVVDRRTERKIQTDRRTQTEDQADGQAQGTTKTDQEQKKRLLDGLVRFPSIIIPALT